MFRTYDEAVAWILSFVNWERVRSRRTMTVTPADRTRFARALGRLGHPERAVPAIHVGGTNGKGSTAAITRALLTAHGLRTGLYTSPHLVDMRERVTIDGRPIGRAEFVRAAHEAARIVEVAPGSGFRTTFEILTALAFTAFRDARVDAMVIEVGLGGRLDSTNVLNPRAVVITSISLDHTEVLGSTVGAIAADKAGIFRRAVPVISAPQSPAAAAELARRARRLGAPLEWIGRDIRVTPAVPTARGERVTIETPLAIYPDCELALRGAHQAENAALAVRAAEQFLGRALDLTSLRAAFRAVRWPGRFQVVATKPPLLVDGAHNPDGAARLAENLERHFPGRPFVAILGVSEGKDVAGILAALTPRLSGLVAVGARHPRAMSPERLAALARKGGLKTVETAVALPEALAAARRMAGPAGGVVVAGSLYLVGDFLAGQKKGRGPGRGPAPKDAVERSSAARPCSIPCSWP